MVSPCPVGGLRGCPCGAIASRSQWVSPTTRGPVPRRHFSRGALREPTHAALDALLALNAREPVAVITEAAELPELARFRRIRVAALRQMCCETPCTSVALAATPLGDADVADMVALRR